MGSLQNEEYCRSRTTRPPLSIGFAGFINSKCAVLLHPSANAGCNFFFSVGALSLSWPLCLYLYVNCGEINSPLFFSGNHEGEDSFAAQTVHVAFVCFEGEDFCLSF